MRFEEVILSNYRQFESIILTFPREKETDLHIIIASNGVGKTNILNAIDWCLYGEESHLGNKNQSLPICNLKALENAKKNNLNKVSVSVQINAVEKETHFQFKRTVEVSPKTQLNGIDYFSVKMTSKTRNTEIYEGNEALNIVNSYLPEKIKQYFFFDGEQLFNYFGKGQNTTNIKDSIHEIAQINVVSRLKEHLGNVIKEKRNELGSLNPATKELTNELNNLIQSNEAKEEDIKLLELQINDANETISELTSKIKGTESLAEDNRRYNLIAQEINELETKIQELNTKKFFELIKDYYISLMFYDINKRTADYILEKESHGLLPPHIDKELLKESLKTHRCSVCECALNDISLKRLESLLNTISVSSSTSNKLMEIKNDTIKSCKEAVRYNEEKTKLFNNIKQLEKRLQACNKEAELLRIELNGCSNIEQIEDWLEQKKLLEKLCTENNQKIGAYKTEIEGTKKKIELKQKQIDEATKNETRCLYIKNELSSLQKASSIIRDVEEEIALETRTRMENETYGFFSNLLWKKNTYKKITLESDYKLLLLDIYDNPCLGSCSAAERELLALAFTLALHKVSHHDSLLFIDTPVGRVSDENRECFAKSLLSVSKNKQLILALTPSEYSDEISTYFATNLSSCQKLNAEDEHSTTLLKIIEVNNGR